MTIDPSTFLEQRILQEDEIVTYSLLARTCGLDVNTSKQWLWSYWQEHPQVKPIFCLLGRDAEGVERVQLLAHSALEASKASLAQVSGLHIYSLQCALPKDSIELLHAVDSTIPLDHATHPHVP